MDKFMERNVRGLALVVTAEERVNGKGDEGVDNPIEENIEVMENILLKNDDQNYVEKPKESFVGENFVYESVPNDDANFNDDSTKNDDSKCQIFDDQNDVQPVRGLTRRARVLVAEVAALEQVPIAGVQVC